MAQLAQQALALDVERVAKRSTSRVVRRPLPAADPAAHPFGSEPIAFLQAVHEALDRAGVKPGDSFYVHRVPPPDRRSHTADVQAAPGSRAEQRRRILAVAATLPDGYTARGLAELAGVDGGWRRVSELVQGGHLEPTGGAWAAIPGRPARVLRITDRGRAALEGST